MAMDFKKTKVEKTYSEKDFKKLQDKYFDALGKAGANGRYRDSLYQENLRLKKKLADIEEFRNFDYD